MKKKSWWSALIIAPLGIFLVAHQLAKWRPQTISQAEFETRAKLPVQATSLPPVKNATPTEPQALSESEFKSQQVADSKPPIFFFEDSDLSAAHLKLKHLAKSQGWNAVLLSPDQRFVLAAEAGLSDKSEDIILVGEAAILRVEDGGKLVVLDQPDKQFRDEWGNIQWSPNSRLVAFSQFEVSPTQVFDARTGAHLWGGKYWGERLRFSPDSRFAAISDVNGEFIFVYEARTGREAKRLPLKQAFTDNWNFSRDSNYLLAEIAPDEFRQLRLR